MITVQIGASTLCNLLGGHFTLEACEAICEYIEDCGGLDPAPMIGDIAISFAEVPADWESEEDEDCTIARLDNGNIVVAR